MYYKLISGTEIIDAGDNPSYVRWQSRNGKWLSCPAELATGIVSSDGSTIYVLEETEGYTTVTIEEITEDECKKLRTELEENGMINVPTDDTSSAAETTSTDEETSSGTQTVAKSKALQLAETLEARVSELEALNESLEMCVLEMSKIVYSD